MDYKKKYLKYKLKYLTVKKLYGGSNYERPLYHRQQDTEDFTPYPVPVIPRIIPNEEGEELLPPALPAAQEQSAFNHSDISPFLAPQEQSALPAPQEQSPLSVPPVRKPVLPSPEDDSILERMKKRSAQKEAEAAIAAAPARRTMLGEHNKMKGIKKAIKKQRKVKQPEAKQVVAVLAETNKESNEASVFEPPTPILDEWAREAEDELTQAVDQDLEQWERQVLAPEEQDEIEQGDDEEIQPPPPPRYKGVVLLPSGKWRARITHKGELLHLGTFDTAEEAADVYSEAKEKITDAAMLENFAREAQQRIEVSGPSAASADIPDLGPIDLERYRSRNKTGYMGVSINKGAPAKKYTANITKDGWNTSLGSYPTIKQAALAYAKMHRQIWGQDPPEAYTKMFRKNKD